MENVCAAAEIDAKTANLFLDALGKVFEDSLGQSDILCIPGFGNFEARKRNERIMSHPSEPGKRLLVPPKVVVSFKPSAILKNSLNETEEDDDE